MPRHRRFSESTILVLEQLAGLCHWLGISSPALSSSLLVLVTTLRARNDCWSGKLRIQVVRGASEGDFDPSE